MRARIITAIFLGIFLLSPSLFRAQTPASKDPGALNLLRSAVSSLANGTNISNATLTGTVTRTAGSDVETGAVTLEALGGTESRVDLSLMNGQQTETINQAAGAPAGQWSDTDGKLHAMASHNCWIPASWFFPALALAEAIKNPSVAIVYVGQETRNNIAVQHIRFWHLLQTSNTSPKLAASLETLNGVDVYLSAADSLPVELDFNLHPDSNPAINFAVEVHFSDYLQTNGIFLPEHIQKLINNSPFLDLHVTGATVNTNVSTSDFAITVATQ